MVPEYNNVQRLRPEEGLVSLAAICDGQSKIYGTKSRAIEAKINNLPPRYSLVGPIGLPSDSIIRLNTTFVGMHVVGGIDPSGFINPLKKTPLLPSCFSVTKEESALVFWLEDKLVVLGDFL